MCENRVLSMPGVVCALLLSTSLSVAQTSVSPTSHVTGNPATSASSVNSPKAQPKIQYSEGRLEITADNSSLNDILRAIAQKTGMRITGAVADERVFGKYGPDLPSRVLERLLQGTGSSMLLTQNKLGTPMQLILTPRLSIPPSQPSISPVHREAPIEAPRADVTSQASAAGSPPSTSPQSTEAMPPNILLTPQQRSQLLKQREAQALQQSGAPH